MAWYLWTFVGAAAMLLALALLIRTLNYLDEKSSERQQAIRTRQASAEQNMQKMVQATITSMFNATRNWP